MQETVLEKQLTHYFWFITKLPDGWKGLQLLLGAYLQQLDGLAVLLLSAQLGRLDEHGPRVARILRLKAGRQFPALVGLRGGRQRAERADQRAASGGGGGAVRARRRTWLVYMASRALLRSMACSCFFTSLCSTPSALVSFTFFLESNTFWSCCRNSLGQAVTRGF